MEGRKEETVKEVIEELYEKGKERKLNEVKEGRKGKEKES